MAYTPRHSHFDNEKDLGPDDSISVVSTSTVSDSQPCTMNIRTPPSSSASTSTPNRSSNIPYITRNSAPGPGSTYIIVHKSGDVIKALTVIRGRLGLVTPLELLPNPPVLDAVQAKTFAGICNWHWHCEESDGWLGFRNAATGLWLRSSSICFDEDKMPEAVHLGGILSDATGSTLGNLGVNEQFCVRKAVDDKGYVLLKRVDHKKTVYLLPVKVVSVRAAMGPAAINPKTADMDKQRMTWEFVEVGHEFTPETRITCQPL
ncbi:hypothetical protein NEUTE1DRAFT_148614 [Neurospora tetrasperma FGSC 2508]|uniref:Uncharacterized protein n=1 Tax=Neurospora tetrasperma (strain FGSC 2508 / ATCC MYA-4615 / P0657) TaxID=510951 RepID=F8MWU6_NEUT8|nr:uncharacterized protein NEUTE1DRAFT_148614 [Neurospora tetrasperma FGSC 2508]EGO54217.1 hypothetical protein NEUTE1DRAFT_148614 [Neurospora tetrasperma FGSC 2508]EGZ68351.1 hypothetical protein NEUTE2DRAFT_118127 [Neurospora tetrasperma FGSC 2509]